MPGQNERVSVQATALLRTAGAPILGLAVAVGSIAMQPGEGTPEWSVWASVALAVGVASGVAFVYGRQRLDELTSRYQLATGTIWSRALLLVLAALVISNITLVLPGAAHATLRDKLLADVVFVFGTSLAASMFAVRAAVARGNPDAAKGIRLKQLMDLRGVLNRVLTAAGALVALVTIEYSTKQQLNQSLHNHVAARPTSYVLIFGAFGSTAVGVAYVSGWAALRSRGQEFLDDLVPIETLDGPSDVVGAMRERQEVASALGIDRSILSDLTAGVVILSPIIVGAIGAFIAR